MKNNKLTIQINKPVEEVFAFTINPKNTPKWIDGIEAEETNEWPVKLGTIYRNHGQDSDWSEYEMTEFNENEMFVMSKKDGSYSVRYSMKPIDDHTTEFEYHEWEEKGELKDLFTMAVMEKLKRIMETTE